MQPRLTQLLAQPTLQVAAIGPRNKTARALGSVVLAAVLSMGAAQVHGSNPVPVTPMTGSAQAAHWLELPSSPFLEAGRVEDGRLSATQLVGSWQQAGLQPEEGKDVLKHLNALTPVAMGVRDEALEARLVHEAQVAVDYLARNYPEAQETLGEMVGQETRVEKNIDAAWREIADAFQGTRADPSAAAMEPGMTMSQAKHNLVEAAGNTGLRALRVPLGNWQSPALLGNLAEGLVLANEDLKRATGWEGRVLGLGGRLELTLGTPQEGDDRNPEGLAFGGRDGRVQVISQWNTLGHEWVHGLDYVLGRELVGARGTLSDEGPQDHFAIAWSDAHAKIVDASPQWQALRQEAQATHGSDYWVDRSELMAYAVSAWMTRTMEPLVLNEDTLERSMREQPFRSPAAGETNQQAPILKDMFRELSGLELTTEPKPRGLGLLIEQRRSKATTIDVGVPLGRTLR